MNQTRKFLSILVLVSLLVLTFITPAQAFDGRSGDKLTIGSDEVIDDDLYVSADEFVLDGTVNGDLIVFGRTMTINGKVDGDVMGAGQTVVVNGEVTGSARIAGSVLFVGEGASIGGDIVSAGYSLEVRQGSAIAQDLIFAGGQILLAGDVARNVQAATAAFELRSAVGADVTAEVGEASQTQNGPPPTMFMPPSSVMPPNVKPGLTLDPSARIEGDLEYTQSKDLIFPAGVVIGKVTRTAPVTNAGSAARQQTGAQQAAKWALDFVRNSVSLLLIGMFLLWLFPGFVRGLSDHLQAKPLPSLGWGVVAWAGFFFTLVLVICVMVIGGILFGVLTLGQLTGTVIWLGLLTLFALIVGFMLVTSFVAKVVFGAAFGRWMLLRLHSPLAEHKYWPMVIGVLITVAVLAMLSFPFLPGALGGLLNFAVVLSGLGALWLWGRERMMKRTATNTASLTGA